VWHPLPIAATVSIAAKLIHKKRIRNSEKESIDGCLAKHDAGAHGTGSGCRRAVGILPERLEP